MINNSILEFARAKQFMSGGVNSPVRSFKVVNGNPIFIRKASGSKFYDVDDNEYIDFCLSWGVHILGHAPGKVKFRQPFGMERVMGCPLQVKQF